MMCRVRRTVTLDPDTELLVKRCMRERGLTVNEAINEAIRAGLAEARKTALPSFATYHMGEPLVDLRKALHLAGQLEGDELARKLSEGR
jgi:hypothetical protein